MERHLSWFHVIRIDPNIYFNETTNFWKMKNFEFEKSNSSFPSFLSKVLKYIQLYNTQFYVQILKKNISTRIRYLHLY